MPDVPHHLFEFLARHPAARRRMIGTPKGSRTLGPFRQALFTLRWFREAGSLRPLARDTHISQATGYHYPHEAIDVLATQVPDLHHALQRREQGTGT